MDKLNYYTLKLDQISILILELSYVLNNADVSLSQNLSIILSDLIIAKSSLLSDSNIKEFDLRKTVAIKDKIKIKDIVVDYLRPYNRIQILLIKLTNTIEETFLEFSFASSDLVKEIANYLFNAKLLLLNHLKELD